MFDIEDQKMGQHIRAAEKARDSRLSVLEDQVKGYTSPFFDGDKDPVYAPENTYYEAVRIETPQMVFNAPRIRLNSRVYGVDTAVSRLQRAANQWVLDARYDEFLTMPATEMQFACPVTLTSLEEHPTLSLPNGKPAKQVVKSRVSPWHYFWDPEANEIRSTEFEGHRYTRDLEDLIEEAEADGKKPKEEREGWRLEELRNLQKEAGIEQYHRHKRDRESFVGRGEVVLYEVWVRHYEEDDHPGAEEGCYGTMLTLAMMSESEGEAEFRTVKDPVPYFGHPDGPYNMLHIYYVPDEVYGLAPAVATEGQSRDLNRHARGSSDSAARYKRLILVDSTDPDLAETVEHGEHDLVVVVEGLGKDKVVPIEIGGITEQNLAYLELAKARYDRVRGTSDTQRGVAPSDTTATASALAEQNADIGIDYAKLRFTQFVRRDLERVLWYFWKSEEVLVTLGPEAAPELGVPTVEELMQAGVPQEEIEKGVEDGEVLAPGGRLAFKGGEKEVDFSDLALEIEPMSMERSNEGLVQRRALEMFQIVIQVAQFMPAMPHVRWEELLDKLGDALNVPDLGTLLDMSQAPLLPPPDAAGQNPAKPQRMGASSPQLAGAGMPGQQNGGLVNQTFGAQ